MTLTILALVITGIIPRYLNAKESYKNLNTYAYSTRYYFNINDYINPETNINYIGSDMKVDGNEYIFYNNNKESVDQILKDLKIENRRIKVKIQDDIANEVLVIFSDENIFDIKYSDIDIGLLERVKFKLDKYTLSKEHDNNSSTILEKLTKDEALIILYDASREGAIPTTNISWESHNKYKAGIQIGLFDGSGHKYGGWQQLGVKYIKTLYSTLYNMAK